MNRVALVTGASRGIGRGIALELARVGFDLVINYRAQAEAASATARECIQAAVESGVTIAAETVAADVGDAPDRQRLIEFVRNRFGRLDLLVNNAGVAPEVRSDLLEASEESFDRLIRINVKGPFFLTQLAARWMVEQTRSGDADYRPKIVTISSISADTASVQRGDYCVSKAALGMLTPLYAVRLADSGVGVFEIRPGIIATDMTSVVREKYDALIRDGLTPIRRWGQPSDVGLAVVAIATDRFPFSTGEVFHVDGGFHIRRL